jgi:hypothetical protein
VKLALITLWTLASLTLATDAPVAEHVYRMPKKAALEWHLVDEWRVRLMAVAYCYFNRWSALPGATSASPWSRSCPEDIMQWMGSRSIDNQALKKQHNEKTTNDSNDCRAGAHLGASGEE